MSRATVHRCVAPGVRDRTALALTAVLLTGCGSSHEPSRTLSSLSLTVYSSEWEADRHLVVVGEAANASIDTWTAEGCLFDTPCPISADVALRSSDPAVLSLQKQVRAPAYVALVAHAPGTATVTATADGLSKSRRIDVVAAPLPLDAIQVAVVANWGDPPVEYDASHNLTWVQVPVGQFAALEVGAVRNGTGVFGIPLQISSSAAGVASGTIGCRPPSVDPHCDVVSGAWIMGVAPGDAQITVSARNVSTSFAAHIVAP